MDQVDQSRNLTQHSQYCGESYPSPSKVILLLNKATSLQSGLHSVLGERGKQKVMMGLQIIKLIKPHFLLCKMGLNLNFPEL